METIHKTAAGKQTGTRTYVLSDSTLDRYGDIIEPDGWELEWFKQNPIALFNHNPSMPVGNWTNTRVEGGRLIADFQPAADGTSQIADDVRKLIDQDILRATSVGFRALDFEPIDPKNPWDGQRYKQQELLEASIVSVPANPAALNIAKQLNISDKTLFIAFGGHAFMTREALTGGHAASRTHTRAAPMKMTPISRHVVETQEALTRARDTAANFAGGDDPDPDQAEVLATEVAQLERKLNGYLQLEKALATGVALADPPTPDEARQQGLLTAERNKLVRPAKDPAPADLLVRAAVCHVLAKATGKDPMAIADERYPNHEATHIVTRAAIAGGTTTTVGWAADLIQLAVADFLAVLHPIAVFPRLAALGVPLTFGPTAGAIRIPSRAATPSISGSFVGEGSPIPVRRIGTQSITLSPHKMGVISVFSRELARYSNPQIEGLLRSEIMIDTAITVDTLLLDAVAGSAVRPPGLTNGVTALTPSALGGYKSILADLMSLAAPFDAANAGRILALLMNKQEARRMVMTIGPALDFGWLDPILTEFHLLVSTTIPAGHVYMVDAADFVSVNGEAEFETSEQAVLHMEDTTPLDIGTPGTPPTVAAPVQSMFQTAQIALRLLLDITWAMRRLGMVQHITPVNWSTV
jgi:HK97 family phage prohead protease